MSFPKYGNIQSFSTQQQDVFVIACTDGKKNGTYVEIGAGYPIHSNNSFLLEYQFGWRGVSVEMNIGLVNEFNLTRRNPCILADATKINYTSLFERCNFDTHIDFLQVDIDPPNATFSALNQINFDKYSFSVITFEHDAYNYPHLEGDLEYVRTDSRKLLEKYGYTRVLSDVIEGRRNPESGLPHGPFEDWYINEKYMTSDNWKRFIGSNVPMDIDSCPQYMINNFSELLQNI
jgi:hypothetical protein